MTDFIEGALVKVINPRRHRYGNVGEIVEQLGSERVSIKFDDDRIMLFWYSELSLI